jgi:D-alanyl-D-alanine carboxypeptidase
MKIAMVIVSIILLIILFVFILGVRMYKKEIIKENPEYIIELVKAKQMEGEAALAIRYNNKEWVNINAKQILPLASTVKIILAIEYAQQAAKGKIDPEQPVSLKTLNDFYIPHTDGGAHEAWLSQLEEEDGKVPLSEVAKGMVAFSSNANTHYLMNLLGESNINQVLAALNLKNHDPIYPITSAMAIPLYLKEKHSFSKDELLEALKEMEMREYRRLATDIGESWLTHPMSGQEKKDLLKLMDMDVQRIWSDRLPGASAEDYLSIMEKLNSKTYFSASVHQFLDPVMEGLMENPQNQEWLEHAGQKGGSTAFVLTNAMYAKDKKGGQTEFVLLADNLSLMEQRKLSRNLNGFQLKFLRDEEFRLKVKTELES